MKERSKPERFLLQAAAEEERENKRGKLKIYLGAAPGVGKTYTMLQDTLSQRKQGLDVVVGVVESHGRHEIENLLKHLEILPPQKVDYQGKTLLEFDLDAALARNSALILIDEMAHTNAPGLRHAKRWQDIKEIIDNGIDVYTTLNVQHIESLNDIVAQIIGTRVRETIPDSILEFATTIELIDLSPEDLLKRLQAGKIYFPKQAELAKENFFRKGNLIALRELALRFTAECVESQVLLYRHDQGIEHIWPTQERILVCVGYEPESRTMIRAAKRLAINLQVEWLAVYVDLPTQGLPDQQRNAAIQNLRLAELLGAETKILTGLDIAKEVIRFAREQNITTIIVGKPIRPKWKSVFLKNIADKIVAKSAEINVYIITYETSKIQPTKLKSTNYSLFWKRYGTSVGIIFFAVLIDFFIYLYTDKTHFFILLITPILAITIGHLNIVAHRQTRIAHLAERRSSALHTLSRRLASARGADKLLEISTRYISEIFDSEVVALLPKNNYLVVAAKYKTEGILNGKEYSIAQWAYNLGEVAGFGTDTLPSTDAIYVPLLASQSAIGVLQVRPLEKDRLFDPEQMHLLEACANQIGLALEVDKLQEESKKKELKIKIDRVRSTLLQSIFRDLHTPLVTIMASTSTLMGIGDDLDKHKIKKLSSNIYVQAEKQSRLINNILQITYLETENIQLAKENYALFDIVNMALIAVKDQLKDKSIQLQIPKDLPEISLDHTLIQEVFINLIENAIKFTPSNTIIEIFASLGKNEVVVGIKDHGPGIVADEINKLFEKFYRGRMLTTESGLGLGLAISKKIIEVHGGKIWAENHKEGGAIFYFTLPL